MSAKIAQALHEVMSKVSYVQKSGKNAFHGYGMPAKRTFSKSCAPRCLTRACS
jgi:hypothetical protein